MELTLEAFAVCLVPNLLLMFGGSSPDSGNGCSSEIPSRPFLTRWILVLRLLEDPAVVAAADVEVPPAAVKPVGMPEFERNSYLNSAQSCSSRPAAETERHLGFVAVAAGPVADSDS